MYRGGDFGASPPRTWRIYVVCFVSLKRATLCTLGELPRGARLPELRKAEFGIDSEKLREALLHTLICPLRIFKIPDHKIPVSGWVASVPLFRQAVEPTITLSVQGLGQGRRLLRWKLGTRGLAAAVYPVRQSRICTGMRHHTTSKPQVLGLQGSPS